VELPRGSLDLGVRSPRCLVFLPGFACPPGAYRSFLNPVALRVGRVVVPSVGHLVAEVTGRSTPVEEAARAVELVDALRADGAEIWLGGHSRGGLVSWSAAPMARVRGLVLVDPVSGGGPPWKPPEPPPAIEPGCPVSILGFGVGGRCAPDGRNHEQFAAALPEAQHVLVPACGHADVLDGGYARFGRLTCGHGDDPATAMTAARDALFTALTPMGALG
jgi:hypothetical protein